MEKFSEYKNKKILITGATGFIGNRLTEILVTRYNADVTVLVRDFGKAMKLGRMSLNFIKGDITKREDVAMAMVGVEFVFHCAYGNKGGSDTRNFVNIEGTKNLLEEAARQKVKAFVFLSTQSVYGIHKTKWLNEDSPKIVKNDPYGQSKLAAEKIVVNAFKELQLNTVILQPTAVYGPWAPSYGTKIIEALRRGRMPLIDGGKGICNAVYVDDLIQAMLLSGIMPTAYGKTYLINGPEHSTWRNFYEYFEKVLNEKCTLIMNKKEVLAYYKKAKQKPSFFRTSLRIIKPNPSAIKDLLKFKMVNITFTYFRKFLPGNFYLKLRNMVKGENDLNIGKKQPQKPVIPLDPDSIEFFSSPTKVKIDKAKKDLQYEPLFTFDKGFSEVEKWYNWYYYN